VTEEKSKKQKVTFFSLAETLQSNFVHRMLDISVISTVKHISLMFLNTYYRFHSHLQENDSSSRAESKHKQYLT